MSALSVFGGVSAILSAAFIGLWIKKRMIRKARFFEDYYAYILFATDKIAYERMPLGELNDRFSEGKKGDFVSFLRGDKSGTALSEEALPTLPATAINVTHCTARNVGVCAGSEGRIILRLRPVHDGTYRTASIDIFLHRTTK